MGLRDTLRQASNSLRKLRRSQGPDSYPQYKREREQARKQEERTHDHEKESAELELEKLERERRYADRYTREREGDTARDEQTDKEPDR
jgi:hypothetical protein